MTTETTTLKQDLERLRDLRNDLALANQRWKDAYDAWWGEVGQAKDQDKRQLSDQVTELEAAIKEKAVAEYEETKEMRPSPGVKIVMKTVASFDPAEALAWAKEHKMALVPESLNSRDYIDLLKSERHGVPGSVKKEPGAQIDQDLGKVLGE